MKITQFAVYGLFGRHDIIVPVRQNRLVIVGINGIGKSTILSIFYYFISQRWGMLSEFHFSRVAIVIDDEVNNYARAKLNEMTGLYLRDVIRGGVEEFKSGSVTRYSSEEIRTIMDRVSEGSLDVADKAILQNTIQKLQTSPQEVTERDKYVAHYFSKITEASYRQDS